MLHQQLTLRIQIISYLLATLAVCILMIDQYRQGLYSLVLSNSIAIPAFLFSAVFLYITRNQKPSLWVHYMLIIVLATLAIYQLSDHPRLMVHYLYVLPLLSFFCLPLLNATVINVIIILIASCIIWFDFGWQDGLRTAINYGLFLGTAWSSAYLTQIKQKSLKLLSLTDRVCGAYNQRHFNHTLKREISRCEYFNDPLSIVAITVNDYGQMIDIYNYLPVNNFLRLFVDKIRKNLRAGDEIFRFKDDLFILLLPNCPDDDSIALMERLKIQLESHTWTPIAGLNVSTSYAVWEKGDTAQELQSRLLKTLIKKQKTTLQLAAFSES